ncbi:MAG: hypothetical protein ACREJ3_03545 [Polyangiaceae bacterium]
MNDPDAPRPRGNALTNGVVSSALEQEIIGELRRYSAVVWLDLFGALDW